MIIVYDNNSSYGVITDEQLKNHRFIGANLYDPSTGIMSIDIGDEIAVLTKMVGDNNPSMPAPKPVVPQPSEE
jgi:hypothetical protein